MPTYPIVSLVLHLTNKNSPQKCSGPVFPQISRSRFTMAVNYSCILKELLEDGRVGFLWGGGGGVCFDRGGEEGGETGWKKSPDFRSPEVGTSGEAPTKKKNKKKKLVLICTLFLP